MLGGADLNHVIKTIILQDDKNEPCVVLMHGGDKDISTKNLAREIGGVKMLKPCDPDFANKLTGYLVGGTSPFGTKKKMKTYIEQTISEIDNIYINGGKRGGFLVKMKSADLINVLKPTPVNVAIDK